MSEREIVFWDCDDGAEHLRHMDQSVGLGTWRWK
jgi:hypothetical protein